MKKTSSTITRASQKSKPKLEVYSAADFKTAHTAIIYGKSGSGKTTLAASFPKPILLVNIQDNGIGSVRKVEKLDVVDVATYEELEEVHSALADGQYKYKTVIIDTITQLQQILVQEKLGTGDGRTKRVSFGTLKRQDWGDIAALVKTILTDFRNLANDNGINVVFLAQERLFNSGEDDDASGIDPHFGPDVSPSIKNTICAAVNIVANTYIDQTLVKKEVDGKKKVTRRLDYCLGLGPSATYIRKVRSDKELIVPDCITDPDYKKLINAIEGDE